MSPVFVACNSGNNPFADCAVERCGDLIRLRGSADMTFAPADAVQLAKTILNWLEPETDARPAPDPVRSSGPAQVIADRLHALFPAGAGWDEAAADPVDANALARDWCLSLAVALEQMRQAALRTVSDGR